MQTAPPLPAWPGTCPGDVAQALGAGDVHLWWMDLAAPPWTQGELASWLDQNEAARAARFHFDVHRRRYVAAHGQMRLVLAAYVGTPAQSLRFTHEDRGKPRLACPEAASDPATETPHAFNLSHSEDHGLLAIARTATLGVDIEVQRHLPDLDALARSHFTSDELRDLHALPDTRRHDGFFAAWTRKEAYVKALGAGLSVPLDSFEVALHPDEPAALRSVEGSEAQARAWTLWAARPLPGTWAAVAVRIPGASVRTFALHQRRAA